MNHSLPIIKSQSHGYKSHLTPIAPAPFIAPKPAQVLPKSINKTSIAPANHGPLKLKREGISENGAPHCIITSKQWVLPPRPKAGRKPTSEKKKLLPSTSSTASMQSLSTNLTSLNIQKSQSDIVELNPRLSLLDLTPSLPGSNLKIQLETATEENQKLKNIIMRLKCEIDAIHNSNSIGSVYSSPISSTPILHSISSSAIESQTSTTSVSTPNTNSNTVLGSRDVSPTVDPKYIGMDQPVALVANNGTSKPRQKGQYKKKKKKDISMDKNEDPHTPISHLNEAGLPVIESIIEPEIMNSDIDFSKPKKRSKITKSSVSSISNSGTVKLERSMSLQTQDMMLSPPPSMHALNRTMSVDPFEFNMHTHNLSRTTTITTVDNDNWDPLFAALNVTNDPSNDEMAIDVFEHSSNCPAIFDGGACLCSLNAKVKTEDSEIDLSKDNMNNYVINENDELDLNFFMKTTEEPDKIGIMGL